MIVFRVQGILHQGWEIVYLEAEWIYFEVNTDLRHTIK
jgi:hypothetical protein